MFREEMIPKAEEDKVKELLHIALSKVKEAMESPIWSYTREFELGKLFVAKSILEDVAKNLVWANG